MPQESDRPAESNQGAEPGRRIGLAEERCPRCHLYFTLSYRENGELVMARCLSCDLRWPRPDVV